VHPLGLQKGQGAGVEVGVEVGALVDLGGLSSKGGELLKGVLRFLLEESFGLSSHLVVISLGT